MTEMYQRKKLDFNSLHDSSRIVVKRLIQENNQRSNSEIVLDDIKKL